MSVARSLFAAHLCSAGLTRCVCPDPRRARRTSPDQFEVTFLSYIGTVRGLLGGGWVLINRMKAFVVANEVDLDGFLLVGVRLRPCCLIL